MRKEFFPKEVGECDEYPGEDGYKVCLEGLDHSFGRVAAVHVEGNKLDC